MAAESGYRDDLKGIQGSFNSVSAAPIDTAAVTNHLKARIDGMTVPQDFSGNPQEWQRRMGEMARENIAEKGLVAKHDGRRFGTEDAKAAIDNLPADYNRIKGETYAMENGQLPNGNMTPATKAVMEKMDGASKAMSQAGYGTYYEDGGKSINAQLDGVAKGLAQQKIPVQDAITYHELSTGKALPAEAKERLLEVEKNTLAAPKASVAPAQPAPAL